MQNVLALIFIISVLSAMVVSLLGMCGLYGTGTLDKVMVVVFYGFFAIVPFFTLLYIFITS